MGCMYSMHVVLHRNQKKTTKCTSLQAIHQLENFKSNLQNHSWTESHRISKAKMHAVVSTYMQPSSKLSFIHCTTGKEIVEKNRRFLTSIVKCLEFCGRQGLALRGHRDDSTAPGIRQQGTFKDLLDFCVDAGDQVPE